MDRIPLRELDLNLLVVLERLLARGSVSAAAADLGLSQPAASRALQRLRQALGDPLLVRVGRGMVLTDRARELLAPVEEALAAARKVFAPPVAFDPATATGDLVIGVGDEVEAAFSDAIARALWERAPGIDLRLRSLGTHSVDEGRRGLIDLAISPDLGPLPPGSDQVDLSEFVQRPLYTRRFVVAAAAGRLSALDLDLYLAASHALVSFQAGGRGFVDELLAAAGHRRRVAASVTSFRAAARLVAATDLLAVVPEEVVRTTSGLDAFPPPFHVPDLPMLLIWHPRRTADGRHRALRELVRRAIIDRVATWGG